MIKPGQTASTCRVCLNFAMHAIVAIAAWNAAGVGLALDIPVKPKQPTAPAGSVPADSRLIVFARQALQQDLLLSSLNLGVTVHERTATVWGTIHSADLARRAEAVVRKVPGIASVRNELRVEQPLLAGKGQTIHTLSPAKPESMSEDKRRLPESLAKFTGWGPPQPKTESDPPIAVSLGVPVTRAPIAPIAHVTNNDLVAAAQKLRDADVRFREIRVDVDGNVVHLRGSVRRWEDAFDLAGAVSRLAGVERVVMGEVVTNRRQSLQVP